MLKIRPGKNAGMDFFILLLPEAVSNQRAAAKPYARKVLPTTDGIDLQALLKAINDRLRILKDSDYTIGHAWLWNTSDLEDLKAAFSNKILHSLQEYFFNDYKKLGLVLGDAFFSRKEPISRSIFARFSGAGEVAYEVLYVAYGQTMLGECMFQGIPDVFQLLIKIELTNEQCVGIQ